MAENSPLDLALWSNILAGTALVAYGYFMWLQLRGIVQPSPRLMFWIRFLMLFMLLTPVAAHYQYSHRIILYLSATIVAVGLLLKFKRKMGL